MYNKTKSHKKIYEMSEEEINEFIKEHISIKKEEKDKYGEVFTSPILINKMLDLFPENVWTNPKLKWLDPSVGTGFFMIFVYMRLLRGLNKWETNEKKRSKHIIENMLFMVEINKTNCDICKDIFGTNARLICGDFLTDLHFPTYNHNDISFDCIVGNPPFQDNHGVDGKGRRINGGKSKLYERIFLKAITMLNPNGYLSFVVPDNIFAGNGSQSYQTILENTIPFVSFNPINQSYFQGIQQPVCYFILHKSNKSVLTNVEHDDKLTFKVALQDRKVNPVRNWTPYTEKLINRFVSNERNNSIYNRGKSIASYKGNKYPIIFTASKLLHTNNPKLAVGLGVKKVVIFSISPELDFKMDYSGKYGAGPNTFYIPFNTNTEGKKLEMFFNSSDYKTLALATKTTRQYLKIAFIEHLKLKSLQKNQSKTRKNQSKTRKTRRHNTKKHKTMKNKY